MAVLADPLRRAHAVTTPLQAARLREELEVELGLNDELDPAWEREADKAVDLLNERFEDLDDVDTEGQGRNGWSASTSRGANRGLDGEPDKPTADKPDKPAAGKRSASTRNTSRRAGASRGASGRRRGGGGRRVARDLGVTGAVGTTTGVILQTLGLVIGLALLYRVLTNAQQSSPGNSVLELATKGISTLVAVVVDPRADPLNAASRQAATGAGKQRSAPQAVSPRAPRRGAHQRQPNRSTP